MTLISDWLRRPDSWVRVYGDGGKRPYTEADEVAFAFVAMFARRAAAFEMTPIWEQGCEARVPRESLGNLPFPVCLFEFLMGSRDTREPSTRAGVLLHQKTSDHSIVGVTMSWPDTKKAPALLGYFEVQPEGTDPAGRVAALVYGSGQFDVRKDHDPDLVLHAAHPAFYAVSMMNCKNVRIVADKDTRSRQQRRNEERAGYAPLNRHRIIVRVPGKSEMELTGYGAGSSDRAAHAVRGHFSEYTPLRPLFGKYAGRFWIPAHVRGKRKEGEDVKPKDYVVIPAEAGR